MAAAGSLGPRKLSDLDPRVAAAFQSHGQASLALREGVRSARFAAYAVALRWLGHGLLPWLSARLPVWPVLALDLGALYCLGCAALYGYRAYNDQGIDPAVLGLSDQQLKRLGLTPPPPGAGRPPLGAADNGLRRRTAAPEFSPAARPPPGAGGYFGAAPPFAPVAATPPTAQQGGAAGFYAMTPSSAGLTSPGSSFGPIETPEDLEQYINFSERQRSEGSPLVASPDYVRLLSPYHASTPPRAAASGAATAGATGAAAPPGSYEAALHALHPSPSLDLWTDRLREWIAAYVLQPLRAALDASHADVAAACAALGPGIAPLAPQPLGAPQWYGGAMGGGGGGGGSGGVSPGGGGALGAAPSASAAAAAAAAVEADPSAEEAQLRRLLEELLPLQRAQLQPALAVAVDGAKAALSRHLALAALLRGASPSGLLAALPPGYVAARVRALAQGTCMSAFSWAAGGDWAGRPWSPELPDDSALVLYLVVAFLLAPGWRFSPEAALAASGGVAVAAASAGGRGGPLFVAALPARPPERYAAVLVAPARPPEAHAGALALTAARAAPPSFHVFARGRELAATAGHAGLLHALVLFFLWAERNGGGALGPARLESPAVALSSIFSEPGDRL